MAPDCDTTQLSDFETRMIFAVRSANPARQAAIMDVLLLMQHKVLSFEDVQAAKLVLDCLSWLHEHRNDALSDILA